MTTIVYCHKTKQVATDSRVTSRGLIVSDGHNKTLKNDVGLWFFTGSLCDINALSALKHDQESKLHLCCQAILINKGVAYSVIINSDKICEHCELKYNWSDGSGMEFAIAALDFGKTAKEAVEYAATKDCYTGGKIRVFNLDGEEVL